MKIAMFMTIMTILPACTGGDLGENKYVIRETVIDVGSCTGGEGFFSGPNKCAVMTERKYKNGKKTTQASSVYGPIISGQTIYKHCWKEDDGNFCFQTSEKYKRSNMGWDSAKIIN